MKVWKLAPSCNLKTKIDFHISLSFHDILYTQTYTHFFETPLSVLVIAAQKSNTKKTLWGCDWRLIHSFCELQRSVVSFGNQMNGCSRVWKSIFISPWRLLQMQTHKMEFLNTNSKQSSFISKSEILWLSSANLRISNNLFERWLGFFLHLVDNLTLKKFWVVIIINDEESCPHCKRPPSFWALPQIAKQNCSYKYIYLVR